MVRWFSLLALVLALAVALWLFTRQVQDTVHTVGSFALPQETQVPPQPWDLSQAQEAEARLRQLLEETHLPHAELQLWAEKAARWAAGCRPGSAEYRAAVALRAAAWELGQAGSDLRDPHRQKARAELERAREALAGSPRGLASGVQDQLQNLQLEQGERLRQVEKELP